MADGGEPCQKKPKLENEAGHVTVWKKLGPHKGNILNAISHLKTSNTCMFCFVKILDCNAVSAIDFTNAWCEDRRNVEEADRYLRTISNIYELFDVNLVERYIREDSDIDVNAKQLMSLEVLAGFLDEIDQANDAMNKLFTKFAGQIPEVAWAGAIGTHVLSKLSLAKQMTISNSRYSNRSATCTCGCGDFLTYGDTSMGNSEVWHGSVDMLLNNNKVAVCIVDKAQEENISSIEVKRRELEENRDQLIAETVVFSHTQKPGLIPTLAISQDKMKIFMYDADADLLYESMELNLFTSTFGIGKQLNICTVLAIWFAINHDIFGKGPGQEHVQFGYFSNFKSMIQSKCASKAKIYDNQMVIGGCSHSNRMKDSFTIDTPTWNYLTFR